MVIRREIHHIITHLVNRSHEANIIRNGIIQISLKEYIHICIDTASNEQDTVAKEISLESSYKSARVVRHNRNYEVMTSENTYIGSTET